MLKHTHHDPYSDVDVDEYGIGVALGRRTYGWNDAHQPILDAAGNDGKDTVTAVMIRDGSVRVFDVDQVEPVKTGG